MSETPAIDPVFLRDGAGEVLRFSPTERLIWKATVESTAGAFDQFELTADPDHEGAPEHIHDAVDETFFVVEGAFQFKLSDELVIAEPGTFVLVPLASDTPGATLCCAVHGCCWATRPAG